MHDAVKVFGLSKSFGALAAVDGISFDIPTGSVYGFLGPNGAGKTTTVRLLNGLLKPDRGKIEILGWDLAKDKEAVRKVCGVQTEVQPYESLSVGENLDIWGSLYGMKARLRKQRINSVLDQFGLESKRDKKAGVLSKGMKQKLLIARALLHEPEILFLDEPTAGLDPDAADDLLSYINRYVKDHDKTVFMCSHRLEEVEVLADSVGIIAHGRLKASGTVDELVTELWPVTEFRVRMIGPKKNWVTELLHSPMVEGASQVGSVLQLRMRKKKEVASVIAFLVKKHVRIVEVVQEKKTLLDLYRALVPRSEDGQE